MENVCTSLKIDIRNIEVLGSPLFMFVKDVLWDQIVN